MKYSKIFIVALLFVLLVGSFLLMLLCFKTSICELMEDVVSNIMLSCIVAIPSALIILYNSSNSTNVNISRLYFKMYLISRDEVLKLTELSNDDICGIKDRISELSKDIGVAREDKLVKSLYDNDTLTNNISELITSMDKYMNSSERERARIYRHIREVNKKIMKQICDAEGIVYSENN